MQEAWRQAKAVLAVGEGAAVLDALGVAGTPGVLTVDGGADAVARLKERMPAHRVWERFPTTGRLAD